MKCATNNSEVTLELSSEFYLNVLVKIKLFYFKKVSKTLGVSVVV